MSPATTHHTEGQFVGSTPLPTRFGKERVQLSQSLSKCPPTWVSVLQQDSGLWSKKKKNLFPPFHLSRREEEEMSCSISRPTSQNWTRKRLVRKKTLSPRDTLTLCSLSLLSFIGPNVCQGPTAMGQAHIT